MKTTRALIALVGSIAASGCVSTSIPVAQPALDSAQAEVKGCYYAGQLFSIGSVKPSMSAVPSDDGGMKLIDDPETAIPLKCVMQFDGTRTTFVWVNAVDAA